MWQLYTCQHHILTYVCVRPVWLVGPVQRRQTVVSLCFGASSADWTPASETVLFQLRFHGDVWNAEGSEVRGRWFVGIWQLCRKMWEKRHTLLHCNTHTQRHSHTHSHLQHPFPPLVHTLIHIHIGVIRCVCVCPSREPSSKHFTWTTGQKQQQCQTFAAFSL